MPTPTRTSAATANRADPQRRDRELPRHQEIPARQGLHLQVRDRHRGAVQPHRLPFRQGAGGAKSGQSRFLGKRPQGAAACRGHLRHRGPLRGFTGRDRRRAQGFAAGPRRGRQRVHRRLRCLGAHQPHQNVVYLKDGEVVHLTPKDFTITTLDEEDVDPVVDQVTWDIEEAELGALRAFHGEGDFRAAPALENAMRGRFSEDGSTAQVRRAQPRPRSSSARSTASFSAPAARPGTPASWPST
jgi:hypothetical protein